MGMHEQNVGSTQDFADGMRWRTLTLLNSVAIVPDPCLSERLGLQATADVVERVNADNAVFEGNEPPTHPTSLDAE
jgi:hypothetical protein